MTTILLALQIFSTHYVWNTSHTYITFTGVAYSIAEANCRETKFYASCNMACEGAKDEGLFNYVSDIESCNMIADGDTLD